jgi:hypothetical protein
LNEGALAVVRLQVTLAGSSVGDGIPDDWKIAHGLDPNDPYVATEDPDQDGLTNLEEYQLGTDPNNPDTDGDGLSDGDEVHLYHTNPLLWDTDGDGISDGVEVRTGSDPLDPSSFNLALALSSVSVDPSSLTLVSNIVYGDASRQLHATGTVIDGRTIDMFRPLYRTSMTSSDLTVASFGAELGRVFAGQPGSATVTVGNSGHAGIASVTVESFTPAPLTCLGLQGFANGVDVAGSYAYVAAGGVGLHVVDVSILATPFVVGHLDTPGNANDVRVAGNVAYVADATGVLSVDIHDPARPALVGRLPIAPGGSAARLALRGNLAYVADFGGWLRILDVSNPAQLQELSALPLAGQPRAVDLSDRYAVVACGTAGIQVVDVSDPRHPVALGATAVRPFGTSGAASVAVRDRLAYIADGPLWWSGGLKVVDFRDPANPVVVDKSGDPLAVNRVALDGNLLLGSQWYFSHQVPIFSIGALPTQWFSSLEFSQPPTSRPGRGTDLVLRNGAVFETMNSELGEFGVTGTPFLCIGRYRLPEAAGSSPPRVSITAPAAGATVRARVPVTLAADASDEVRVSSVSFLVDGVVVGTSYQAPFQATFVPPSGRPILQLGAVVTNAAGVQASALPVTVNVESNTLPVATLLTPRAGQTAVAGLELPIAAQASDDHGVTKVEIYVNGALAATRTAPPWRLDYTVPAGATSLAVTVLAYDDGGPGNPDGPVTVMVVPDQPPSVAVRVPEDGAKIVEGTTFNIVVAATDDSRILSVQFFVDGTEVGFNSSPPYLFHAAAPSAGQLMTIHAVGFDDGGLRSTSADIVVQGVPDPGTTVNGSVTDGNGSPVAGATVTVSAGGSTLTASTGAGGSFSIAQVPAAQGNLFISASGTVGGCAADGRLATPVPPVVGGSTDVGAITITAATAQTTTVTGTVIGPDGQPFAGASVQVTSADLADMASAASGAGGALVLPVFPARSWAIFTLASATVAGAPMVGGAGSSGAAVAGGATSVGQIQLQPAPNPAGFQPTTVVGKAVIDSGGTPAAGAQVIVDDGTFGLYLGVAASDGSFAIPGVLVTQGSGFNVGVSLRLPCVLLTSGSIFSGQLILGVTPGGTTDIGRLVLSANNGPPSS